MPRPMHFEIHAADPKRAIRFYSEVFGWEFQEWEGNERYWLIVTGPKDTTGIDGGLVARRGEPPVDGQPVNAFVCTVDVPDVDDYVARVQRAGGTLAVAKAAVRTVGWMAYVKDPEGNIVGMMQTDAEAR